MSKSGFPNARKADNYDLGADYNYSQHVNATTGEIEFYSKSTGKQIDTTLVQVPCGTTFQTPEDKARKKQYAERKVKREERTRKWGAFNFVSTSEKFENIPPATIARIILLYSYLDNNGRLVSNPQSELITRKKLLSLLKISDASVTYFLRDAAAYIACDAKTGIIKPTPIGLRTFMHGKLARGARKSWMRVYHRALRRLYNETPTSKHKHLGYIFRLLPYVNVKFNIVCHPDDVLERDETSVRCATLEEFCEHIKYSYNHAKKMLTALNEITFKVGNYREHFCMLINNGLDIPGSYIIINPRVMYGDKDEWMTDTCIDQIFRVRRPTPTKKSPNASRREELSEA